MRDICRAPPPMDEECKKDMDTYLEDWIESGEDQDSSEEDDYREGDKMKGKRDKKDMKPKEYYYHDSNSGSCKPIKLMNRVCMAGQNIFKNKIKCLMACRGKFVFLSYSMSVNSWFCSSNLVIYG